MSDSDHPSAQPLPPAGDPRQQPDPPPSGQHDSFNGNDGAAPRRKSHGAAVGESKQITRSRVSYSCHSCRRRKVKCDKVHPVCGNCLKTGAACVYDSRSLLHKRRPSDENQQRSKRRRDPQGPRDNKDRYRDLRRLAGVPLAELLATHGGLPEEENEEQGEGGQQQGRGSGDIAARLDRLTSMVERLSKAQPPEEGLDENLAAAYDIAAKRQAFKRSAARGSAGSNDGSPAGSRMASRPSSPKRQPDQNNNDDFPIPSGRETDLVDPVGTLNLGHLSLDECGKSQYVGTTYWAYISDEIQELNELLRHQTQSQEGPSPQTSRVEEDEGPSVVGTGRSHGTPEFWPTNDGPAHSYPDGSLSPPSTTGSIRPEILDNIPTRRQSDILYKGFMSGVQAISPVTHPPTVLHLYQKFWRWYDHGAREGEPFPKPSFVPLLYAIWYGGSVTISLRTIRAEFSVETRPALSALFHDQVTRWLKRISFPRNASLHGLAAFLLVQTILSKEEEPLTSSLFISLALRVAQSMGLHRDPAQFGIPPCEAETRRRVWWHIVHMDGVVAMSSGLPPQVSDENYWDVRVTSDVKDTLIETTKGAEYERLVNENARKPDVPDDPNVCGRSMVNVHYISAKGKYVMAQAIRKILKIQLGTKPVTRKDMKDLRVILIDLTAKLRDLVNRIPVPRPGSLASNGQATYPAEVPDSGGGPGCGEQYHTPVLAAFHKWARILLALFVHKAFCVAYQPFLKNAKSEIWPAARQCALRHCHGFMEKFILLATDPDFQPFQWSWPGNHQPMHATMIMLIDLYERPNSPQAPKSRAFIDKIFSLSGPDGGVVGGEDGISTSRPLKDGGREAWDMMRRLREKAWQKAGLDPTKLWTEQAQVQVGVAPASSQPHGRPDATRAASAGGQGTASFADGYYSLIKEREGSSKNQMPGNTTRWGHVKSEQNTSPVGASWQNPADADPAQSSMGAERHMWPSPSSLLQTPPLPSFSMPGSSASTTSANYQAMLPEFVAGFAAEDMKHGLPANFPGFSPTAGDGSHGLPGSAIPGSQQPQQQPLPQNPQHQPQPQPQPQPPLPPPLHVANNNNVSATPSNKAPPPQTPSGPANVNFDWDQWDAVFGEYLPVVDGFMDLDPSPGMMDPGQAQHLPQPHPQQGQQGQQTQQGPLLGAGPGTGMSGNGGGGGMLGLVPEDIVGFDEVGGVTEWAELG